jgi:hypothetical protein
MDKPLVVGYYTQDGRYPQLAVQMQASARRWGLACEIFPRTRRWGTGDGKPPQPWVFGCGEKPYFLRDMRRKFPREKLLYLDVDAEIVKDPVWFEYIAPEVDMGVLYSENKTHGIISNVLWFNNNATVDTVLGEWCDRQNEACEHLLRAPYLGRAVWDQTILTEVLYQRGAGVNVVQIPYEYGKIDSMSKTKFMAHVKPEDIVIKQHQESRFAKKRLLCGKALD